MRVANSLGRCAVTRKAVYLGGHVPVRWARDIAVVFDIFLEPRLGSLTIYCQIRLQNNNLARSDT